MGLPEAKVQHRQAQNIGESAFKREKNWSIFLYCWFLQFGRVCEFVWYYAVQRY